METQFRDEPGHLGIRQRRMMQAVDLRAPREKCIKVSPPAGWVLARAETLGLSCIEDPFNPTSQPRSGLVLALPNRRENFQDVSSLDCIKRYVPQI
jgi:hypothetical protein